MRIPACSAALALSLSIAPDALAQPVCGDVNDSGSVTSSDALAVLRAAVGQPGDLICDECGSTCPGDPRYLLGEWTFESDFSGSLYQNYYDLVAVDEINCEIVGEDLDDGGIVYAYAGAEYDYVLLSANETYCDLFVFDYVGPDEVEGVAMVLNVDEFGDCNFDDVTDEGSMVGERGILSVAASSENAVTGGAAKAAADPATTVQASSLVEPRFASLIDRVQARYEKRSHR